MLVVTRHFAMGSARAGQGLARAEKSPALSRAISWGNEEKAEKPQRRFPAEAHTDRRKNRAILKMAAHYIERACSWR